MFVLIGVSLFVLNVLYCNVIHITHLCLSANGYVCLKNLREESSRAVVAPRGERRGSSKKAPRRKTSSAHLRAPIRNPRQKKVLYNEESDKYRNVRFWLVLM